MNPTPDQVAEFLKLLSRTADSLTKIADKPYSISGASDWAMLVALGVVIMATIGFGGKWIIYSISKDITTLSSALIRHQTEDTNDHNRIWAAHEDCQRECCPRLGRITKDRVPINGRVQE